MSSLYERLHPNDRRPCHTANCEREAIRDGAYCSDCTNVVWTTGSPPVIVVPEWLHRLTARDNTGAVLGGGPL